MKTIKIRYRGKLIGNQWQYDRPKIVELPIPFCSHSEKIGEVICAPVGEFPEEYGYKLLAMSGENGPFIEELPPKPEPKAPVSENSFIKVAKRKGNPNWVKGRKRSTSPKSAAALSTSPASDAGQGETDGREVGVSA